MDDISRLDNFQINDDDRKSLAECTSLTSGDVTFEGQWEEDDLMALSGKPGQSFQKIQTTTNAISEESMTSDGVDSSLEPSSPQCNSGIDLEWDNDTPIFQPHSNEIPAMVHNQSIWKTVVIGDKNFKLDLSAITPYRQVLSHGGYYGEGLNAIVVFSACYLPDTRQSDYHYIMDNLFLYVVSTLDVLVAEGYMIIFFNGGCSRKNFPAFKWLKKCYDMIHRRLRKNLQQLVIVHPSWYIRLFTGFFRPFISKKFSRKLKLVESLHRLADIVSLDGVTVPEAVQQRDLKLQKLKKDSSSEPVSYNSQSEQCSNTLQ